MILFANIMKGLWLNVNEIVECWRVEHELITEWKYNRLLTLRSRASFLSLMSHLRKKNALSLTTNQIQQCVDGMCEYANRKNIYF